MKPSCQKPKKKYEKKDSFKNWKWFDVAVGTRIPKFLHEEDTQQGFLESHLM